MRLWPKQIIDVLPDKQLTAQWRELAAIAKKIILRGTPNHGLVNKVLDYKVGHFISYSKLVMNELHRRGKKTSKDVEDLLFSKILNYSGQFGKKYSEWVICFDDIYIGWHNERYLRQCFYNLQEKADCGIVPIDQFNQVLKTCEIYGIS
jgi:uncharacterized protein (TIGR02328 family)